VYDETYYTERNAYIGDNTIFEQMFGRLLDGAQAYKPSGSLLDVGCGTGHLLRLARARGYTVGGCDISPWATAYARDAGLEVRTGTLESLHYPSHAFDIVTVSHTLEHVPHPLSFLQEVRRVLAADGLLVIAVPNFGSVMAQTLRTRWAGLLPDQHLWHFTPATLRLLLSHGGFRPLRVSSDPYLHRHANRIKDAALVALSGFGSLIGRSDYMTAFATPQGAPDKTLGKSADKA
jgi:SAM-dependent methyltransferase